MMLTVFFQWVVSQFIVCCFIFTSDKGGAKCFCLCSFVCLSVSKITQKNMSMDLDEMLRVDNVGTWTNSLTFEPDSE